MIIDRQAESRIRAALEPARRRARRTSAAKRAGSPRPSASSAWASGHHPLWVTGLPASGKSSIAKHLEWRLHCGTPRGALDGDNLRFGHRDLSFSKEARSENVRRIAEVARLFNQAGTVVLVPAISPFREDRERAREIVGADRFVEIFLTRPSRRARRGTRRGCTAAPAPARSTSSRASRRPTERPENPSLTSTPYDSTQSTSVWRGSLWI